ncbi:hypothetical protein FHW31_003757 [Enterobacter asburiae]|jgi:hypothetical protein|nr:hypothetical protein P346_03879 [Enterobacter sp. DC1]NIH92282.1 hypothetical protein [Enterobacter asburiae]
MPLSSRFGRISGGSFTGSIPETFTKKSPRAGGNVIYGYVLVVGFPGASVKALSVNICTGVHVAVAAGLTG